MRHVLEDAAVVVLFEKAVKVLGGGDVDVAAEHLLEPNQEWVDRCQCVAEAVLADVAALDVGVVSRRPRLVSDQRVGDLGRFRGAERLVEYLHVRHVDGVAEYIDRVAEQFHEQEPVAVGMRSDVEVADGLDDGGFVEQLVEDEVRDVLGDAVVVDCRDVLSEPQVHVVEVRPGFCQHSVVQGHGELLGWPRADVRPIMRIEGWLVSSS